MRRRSDDVRNRRGFWSEDRGTEAAEQNRFDYHCAVALRVRLIFNLPISEVVALRSTRTWEVAERESRSRRLIGVIKKVERGIRLSVISLGAGMQIHLSKVV